jgi:hypothetical protein
MNRFSLLKICCWSLAIACATVVFPELSLLKQGVKGFLMFSKEGQFGLIFGGIMIPAPWFLCALEMHLGRKATDRSRQAEGVM